MDFSNWLFWNVDTQLDFISPKGKLYVEGAEKLRPKWAELTALAEKKSLRVVNTADFHYSNSAELDPNPDFINTFPEHCMANTRGAVFVKETKPEDAVIFDWDKEYMITPDIFSQEKSRNIVIRKDAFDVFEGSPHTDTILKYLNPETVVVYGVTTNVCVDAAVKGLFNKVKKIYVIEDAIKELPKIPLPFESWDEMEIEMITVDKLKEIMGEN